MSRVLFPKGRQGDWFLFLLKKKGASLSKLSLLAGVTDRTMQEWIKGNFTVPVNVLEKISLKYGQVIPKEVQIVSDYWYVKKGAQLGGNRRVELFGIPATPEGRKKGGRVSQLNRRLFPDKYLNCNLRKVFSDPDKSTELAELIGIILGDGGMTFNQLKITLNKETEPGYVNYVANLLDFLFKEKPSRYYFGGRAGKTCNLCLSGVGIVEILKKFGLVSGNKVKNQVEVPSWIVNNSDFSSACVRGLVDTDGCIYIHKHKNRGVNLINLGLNFTNRSYPLLGFVYNHLQSLGYAPKTNKYSIWLYREAEVIKYMSEIKSHNDHHQEILQEYLEMKPRRGV